MINNQIKIRLNALDIALREINAAYKDTLKCVYEEVGIEVGKSYKIKPGEDTLFKKADRLKKEREELLYYRIFCFSQVVYSLKDFLKKLNPEKKQLIENFFSESRDNFLTRKELSNNLKHNPGHDMKFGLVVIDEKTEIQNKTRLTTMKYKWNWHINGLDSIEHCEKIHMEIFQFINEEFLKD